MSQLATIVVCPRERFRPLPRSLRSLFATIDRAVRVIVVDGGCPDHIRRELKEIQAERPYELLETGGFVLPSQARNMGLDMAQTKYIVYCDHDLAFTPGWLDALVRNAEANGSAAVSPVTLIGPSEPVEIHHAGGRLEIVGSGDKRWFRDRHLLEFMPLEEAEANDFAGAALDHTNIEFHCVLLDVATMREIGGFDERLIINEHMDTSMRLVLGGHRITFEKTAKVMYLAYEPFTAKDWPYFLFRWAQDRADETDRILSKAWGTALPPGEPGMFARFHTKRAARTVLKSLPPPFNRSKVRKALEQFYLAFLRWRYSSVPDLRYARTLPPPPADAIERIMEKLKAMPGR